MRKKKNENSLPTLSFRACYMYVVPPVHTLRDGKGRKGKYYKVLLLWEFPFSIVAWRFSLSLSPKGNAHVAKRCLEKRGKIKREEVERQWNDAKKSSAKNINACTLCCKRDVQMPHAKSAAVLCTRRPQDQDFFLMWPQGGTIKSTGARTRKRAIRPKIENPKGMLVTEYLIQCTKIIKVTKSRTKLIFPRQNYWLSTTSSGCLFFSWARVSLMRKPLAPRGHTANKKTSTVLHWLGLSAITRLLWGFYM